MEVDKEKRKAERESDVDVKRRKAETPVESPKVEPPKAEKTKKPVVPKASPKAEAAKVEPPKKVEAPKAEVPREAPKTEAPKVEPKKPETAKAESPAKPATPKTEPPKKVEPPKSTTETAKAEVPKETPKVSPKAETAKVEPLKKVEVPKVEPPKEEEREVPPPQHPVTNCLFVRNFVRPFTVPSVEELLNKQGKVLQYAMDSVRSKCYAVVCLFKIKSCLYCLSTRVQNRQKLLEMLCII
jgi:hypothetical protein